MTSKFINGYPRVVDGRPQKVDSHWRGGENQRQGSDLANKPNHGPALNQVKAKPLIRPETPIKAK